VDGSVGAVYPTASSAAFAYEAGYQAQSVVGPGQGYWLKFAGSQSVDLEGGAISADTVAVVQGWNIVGSLSFPVATASIQSDPGGLVTSPFYGYDAGYLNADTLQPGYGYWVKVAAAGSLILQAAPLADPVAVRTGTIPATEVPAAAPKQDR
jgi:hypothetical protein